ncbi:hypothetical protein FGB62_22g528 [Gracilaria domingensis]|nr:hypothetical protein FGB62_22g528 [Gracilaria domingensis]
MDYGPSAPSLPSEGRQQPSPSLYPYPAQPAQAYRPNDHIFQPSSSPLNTSDRPNSPSQQSPPPPPPSSHPYPNSSLPNTHATSSSDAQPDVESQPLKKEDDDDELSSGICFLLGLVLSLATKEIVHHWRLHSHHCPAPYRSCLCYCVYCCMAQHVVTPLGLSCFSSRSREEIGVAILNRSRQFFCVPNVVQFLDRRYRYVPLCLKRYASHNYRWSQCATGRHERFSKEQSSSLYLQCFTCIRFLYFFRVILIT